MPTLSSFSAINYNLHVSVKILGGFLHVWNFRISVPLLQMSRIWSRRDMPRWAETTSAKAARGEVVRGPGSTRWVKVEEVAGDGKKVTLGVGTKDMQMRSWRWEKAPTLSGEACTAAQRRLAEKEKMGLQRVQISATNVSFLDVYWCAFHLFRGQDHYTGVCRLLQASMHVQRRDMMTWMDIAPKGAWRIVITKAIPGVFHSIPGFSSFLSADNNNRKMPSVLTMNLSCRENRPLHSKLLLMPPFWTFFVLDMGR